MKVDIQNSKIIIDKEAHDEFVVHNRQNIPLNLREELIIQTNQSL